MPREKMLQYKPGLVIPGEEYPEGFEAEVVEDIDEILQGAQAAYLLGQGRRKSDESSMSASYTILTRAKNRHGNQHQIGETKYGRGMQFDDWAQSPIVFIEHAQHYPYPVGVARTPSGKVALQANRSRVDSECFFHQRSRAGVNAFHLSNDGILGMASVGFDPVKALPLNPPRHKDQSGVVRMHDTMPGWEFVETILREWSLVATGADPGAVRKVLTDQKYHGDRLDQSIRQSLEPYCEAKPAIGIGFDPQRLAVIEQKLDRVLQQLCDSGEELEEEEVVEESSETSTEVADTAEITVPAEEPVEPEVTVTTDEPAVEPVEEPACEQSLKDIIREEVKAAFSGVSWSQSLKRFDERLRRATCG